jgi:hypothetical protein
VRHYRSYADAARALGLTLDAACGLSIRETGKYLVHSERDGRPHCIGVHNDGQGVNVYSGQNMWTCSYFDLEDTHLLLCATCENCVALLQQLYSDIMCDICGLHIVNLG